MKSLLKILAYQSLAAGRQKQKCFLLTSVFSSFTGALWPSWSAAVSLSQSRGQLGGHSVRPADAPLLARLFCTLQKRNKKKQKKKKVKKRSKYHECVFKYCLRVNVKTDFSSISELFGWFETKKLSICVVTCVVVFFARIVCLGGDFNHVLGEQNGSIAACVFCWNGPFKARLASLTLNWKGLCLWPLWTVPVSIKTCINQAGWNCFGVRDNSWIIPLLGNEWELSFFDRSGPAKCFLDIKGCL